MSMPWKATTSGAGFVRSISFGTTSRYSRVVPLTFTVSDANSPGFGSAAQAAATIEAETSDARARRANDMMDLESAEVFDVNTPPGSSWLHDFRRIRPVNSRLRVRDFLQVAADRRANIARGCAALPSGCVRRPCRASSPSLQLQVQLAGVLLDLYREGGLVGAVLVVHGREVLRGRRLAAVHDHLLFGLRDRPVLEVNLVRADDGAVLVGVVVHLEVALGVRLSPARPAVRGNEVDRGVGHR